MFLVTNRGAPNLLLASPAKQGPARHCLDVSFSSPHSILYFGQREMYFFHKKTRNWANIELKGTFTHCDLSGRFRILMHVIYIRRKQNAFARKFRCTFVGEPLNHIRRDTKSLRLIAVSKRSLSETKGLVVGSTQFFLYFNYRMIFLISNISCIYIRYF